MKAPFPKIKTAIVPIGLDKDDSSALAMAKALAGEVVLVGVVTVHNDEMVSAGARAARSVRKRLMELSEGPKSGSSRQSSFLRPPGWICRI